MSPIREDCLGIERRGFLKLAGAALGIGLFGEHLLGGVAYAAALTKAQRDSMTPDDILAMMKKGNERFRRGEKTVHDYLAEQRASAAGQYPAAVILSCIDSRAPVETVMDLGIGDIFGARVAGNVVNDDILGSLEYSCKVAGAKVIVVMGHTGCGAIKGAIDRVEFGNLTGLLAKIRPAVEATKYEGERSAKNYGFVDAVARTNVELAVRRIREGSPILRDLDDGKAIEISGAMYNLETAAVDFFMTT